MKIKIEIDCDTISQIHSHLYVIGRDLRKHTKKFNLNPVEDEFPKRIKFDDENCYGEHIVKITP